MTVVAGSAAALLGYLIGSMPTAEWLGRLAGVDLRGEGSGNPGTNNALRLGGRRLAAGVLVIEMSKGAIAVIIGAALAGDAGAIVAAVGAAAGNVFNIFYRFRGGKGLGIVAGVLITIWPTAFAPVIALLVIAVLITRSSGAAAIITIVGVNIMAILWATLGWPMGWGIDATPQLLLLSLGLGAVLWRKHWADSTFSRQHRHSLQGPA